jgi:uncharacterized protein (DUF2141 family)
MILLTKHVAVYLVLMLSSLTGNAQSYDLTVHINNLDSNEGQVLVGLYDSEKTFLKTSFKGEASTIKNNACTVVFKNVPAGIYAVSYVHDENNNGKMDTNFIGIPKEGYGCSNNAEGFMGPPDWDDAKFDLQSVTEITIN